MTGVLYRGEVIKLPRARAGCGKTRCLLIRGAVDQRGALSPMSGGCSFLWGKRRGVVLDRKPDYI